MDYRFLSFLSVKSMQSVILCPDVSIQYEVVMKINIISIGNSKGIRIPKSILKQCHMDKEVELETQEDKLIIKPVKKKLRKGWKEAFGSMRKREEDTTLIDESLDMDMENWEW